jgi:hypothetical protein
MLVDELRRTRDHFDLDSVAGSMKVEVPWGMAEMTVTVWRSGDATVEYDGGQLVKVRE